MQGQPPIYQNQFKRTLDQILNPNKYNFNSEPNKIYQRQELQQKDLSIDALNAQNQQLIIEAYNNYNLEQNDPNVKQKDSIVVEKATSTPKENIDSQFKMEIIQQQNHKNIWSTETQNGLADLHIEQEIQQLDPILVDTIINTNIPIAKNDQQLNFQKLQFQSQQTTFLSLDDQKDDSSLQKDNQIKQKDFQIFEENNQNYKIEKNGPQLNFQKIELQNLIKTFISIEALNNKQNIQKNQDQQQKDSILFDTNGMDDRLSTFLNLFAYNYFPCQQNQQKVQETIQKAEVIQQKVEEIQIKDEIKTEQDQNSSMPIENNDKKFNFQKSNTPILKNDEELQQQASMALAKAKNKKTPIKHKKQKIKSENQDLNQQTDQPQINVQNNGKQFNLQKKDSQFNFQQTMGFQSNISFSLDTFFKDYPSLQNCLQLQQIQKKEQLIVKQSQYQLTRTKKCQIEEKQYNEQLDNEIKRYFENRKSQIIRNVFSKKSFGRKYKKDIKFQILNSAFGKCDFEDSKIRVDRATIQGAIRTIFNCMDFKMYKEEERIPENILENLISEGTEAKLLEKSFTVECLAQNQVKDLQQDGESWQKEKQFFEKVQITEIEYYKYQLQGFGMILEKRYGSLRQMAAEFKNCIDTQILRNVNKLYR